MKIRRLAGIAALVALVITAISTRGFGLIKNDDPTLTLYGNVDIRQVDLGFRVPGRIAAEAFEEGAKVPLSAVLARLDLRPLRDAVAVAAANVSMTNAELAKRRNGNRPQDIAQARSQMVEQQATLGQARDQYARAMRLLPSGAISRESARSDEANLATAQARVNTATQVLSLQNAGSRREDIDSAVAQRASAIASRERAETDLADATIFAPAAGTVLTRAREVGAIVQSGETVYTLTIDRPMRIRAYVAESDLTRISPGMAVSVTADGNTRTYHGNIGFIAPTAEFTPKSVQTQSLRTDLVYRMRIIVTDPDDALRQGAPVSIVVPGARAAAKH